MAHFRFLLLGGAGLVALPLFSQGHGASLGVDSALALAALGLAASWYPAWLAALLDPQESLRAL